MKTAIFCISVHHGNTAKLAEAARETLGADLYKVEQLSPELLENYELVGFFSGIYKFSHHDDLIAAVKKLPPQDGKKALIASTSGSGKPVFHKKLAAALGDKGFTVIGEYACRSFITFGPFGLFGGLNKGKPDERDLAEASAYFQTLAQDQVE